MNAPDGRRRIDVIDLCAGICVMAGCAVTAWIATGYGVGTPRRMGAGFLPLTLGVIGAGMGAAMILRALFWPMHNGRPVQIRRLLFIGGGFLVFALLLEPAGLLITVFAATLLSSFADPEARLIESALLGAGLALAIWVVFVVLMGLGIPVLPGQA